MRKITVEFTRAQINALLTCVEAVMDGDGTHPAALEGAHDALVYKRRVMRGAKCEPVWGSCNLKAGHKGTHDAGAKESARAKKRAPKMPTGTEKERG